MANDTGSPDTRKSTRVGVIGCGIAGPVLAMLLKKRGYDPVIYERLDTASAGGIALMFQTNGLKVLNLLPEVFNTLPGQMIDSLLLVSNLLYTPNDESRPLLDTPMQSRVPQSAILGYTDKPKTMGGESWGWRAVKREEVLAHFTRCAQEMGIPIRWGHKLVAVEEVCEGEAEEVEMRFENGKSERASFVVGCDGLRSGVRTALFGPEEPKFTGVIQTAGFSPILPSDPAGKHTFTSFFTLGAHLITVPLSDTIRCWAISSREDQTNESWRSLGEEAKEAFRAEQAKKNWGFGVDVILQNTSKLVKYGLYDRPALKTWHKGRAVLLGDAAHPTTPHTGQGANQSLEDIYQLVLSLQTHHPDPFVPPTSQQLSQAFSEYETPRIECTSVLVARALRYGSERVEYDLGKAKKRDEAERRLKADEKLAWQEIEGYAKGPFHRKSELLL